MPAWRSAKIVDEPPRDARHVVTDSFGWAYYALGGALFAVYRGVAP